MTPRSRPSILVTTIRQAVYILYIIWQFTESNFSTFTIPNTAFGVLGAFAASVLIENHQDDASRPGEIIGRIPTTMLFNWCMTLIFDLSNQRGAISIQEDRVNKPWRPIPSGKVTADQARRITLVAVPLCLALCYTLGVWNHGTVILILTWLYNDLQGSDELVRDLILAVAFAIFNSASLQITAAAGRGLSGLGILWIAVISAVILTTMQVQDLKDQAGDRIRGRRTVPLFFGEKISRLSIAGGVCFWSYVCAYFWRLPLWVYSVPASTGGIVMLRVLSRRTPEEDARTWKWWCLWTVTLYSLPAISLVTV
ncbi:UbiA prenyltransferase family-domain-containing protein [Pseudomassariella vexata]|uniref:UbiA prenyltransferase family-domain-containing protein n=1 Tax=Pseudomassariella vexata TaxID=1141098 RepID=A0A1Y2E6F0_9PEZI|nr:UbiA prenyltransferase family-domain-containing protein [Pseudomassariella vexata]ORY67017.1 UbiA prenyltransferase family-domain-containing protein [Pseudomassariella vexata]